MIELNPFQYQQMAAGGAGSANVNAGQYQQSFGGKQDQDTSIFESNPFVQSVNGVGATTPGGVNPVQGVGPDGGIVGRLDAIDAKIQNPEQRNSVLGKNLYILG